MIVDEVDMLAAGEIQGDTLREAKHTEDTGVIEAEDNKEVDIINRECNPSMWV